MPAAARSPGVARRRGLFAALIAAIVILQGIALTFGHNLNSLDGALQTWFALDHFAQGRQLGHAFQSYLGITMILALLPAYFALGQTLFASTFAAIQMVVAGAFAGGFAIAWFLRPIGSDQRWLVAIVLVFVFYYLAGLAADALSYPYPATLDPGVSLRPLRGALPFFALPVFVATLRKIRRDRSGLVPGVLLGLAAGVGLLWSNDAGIPLVIALTLGLVIGLLRQPAVLAQALGGLGVGTTIAAIALLTLVTHGAPEGWLRYNFRDIAGDQFWYFGPWDRAARILEPADLLHLLNGKELLSNVSLVLLAVSVGIASIRRLAGRGFPVRDPALIFVGSSIVGTALLPQIGGHIGVEYNAITFVLGLCAPLILFQRPLLRLARPLLRTLGPRTLSLAAAIAAFGIVAVEVARVVIVLNDGDRTVYNSALGFHVTPEYAVELAAMEQLGAHWRAQGIPAHRQLLSVYTSPLDIAAGAQRPAPVGSLIHALGPNNRAFMTDLVASRSVAAVTTIAPDYSGWEGWNLRANWPFFRALLENYMPIGRTDQNLLWVRASAVPAATRLATPCRVLQSAPNILLVEIAAQAPGLASVTIERQGPYATGRSALLTVIESSPATRSIGPSPWDDFPRYGIANADILEMVAPVDEAGPTRLQLAVMDGSAIGIADCRAEVYPPIDHGALPSLPEAAMRYISGDMN